MKRDLVLWLFSGALLLAAGVVAAATLAPEWGTRPFPPRQYLVERFAETAESRVSVAPGTPRVEVVSSETMVEAARRILGHAADEWLSENGVGTLAVMTRSVEWSGVAGELTLGFSSRGQVWSADWRSDAHPGSGGDLSPPAETLCELLLRPSEWLDADVARRAGRWLIIPIGGEPEQHLAKLELGGGIFTSSRCTRRLGSPDLAIEWQNEVSDLDPWPVARGALLALLVLPLFVALAVKRRIDLTNGAFIASLVLIAPIPWWVNQEVDTLWMLVLVQLFAAGWILLAWATTESMLRATVPDFTTTLDTLLRARLGPRGGRELLLGSALGMALAGCFLLVHGGLVLLPGVDPNTLATDLPMLRADGSLIEWLTWGIFTLLALGLALRFLPAAAASAVAAAGISVILHVPLDAEPTTAGVVGRFLLSLGLLLAFSRVGLTAVTVSVLLAPLLTAGVFGLWHLQYMAATSGLGLGALALVLGLGTVGIARSHYDERSEQAVPGFLRRLERERRLTYEMEILARLQTGLLPSRLPSIDSYDFAAHSSLATEAGGDLYDFLLDEGGGLWIACGDVSGHGYSCAIALAAVKAALISGVHREAAPEDVLAEVDRVLRATVTERMFTSLCLVKLESRTGACRIANAGHPFAFECTDGDVVREVELPSFPLGQGPARHRPGVELILRPDSILVLYTDGLYEAANGDGQPYGFEQPKEVIRRHRAAGADAILEAILADWQRHLEGADPEDDTTLVVVKRTGSTLGPGRAGVQDPSGRAIRDLGVS